MIEMSERFDETKKRERIQEVYDRERREKHLRQKSGKVTETAKKASGKRTVYIKPQVEELLKELVDDTGKTRSAIIEEGIVKVWQEKCRRQESLEKREKEKLENADVGVQLEKSYMRKIMDAKHVDGWQQC